MTLKCHNPGADLYVPGGGPFEAAAAGVTHLSIGAHADDTEAMAVQGVCECRNRADRGFACVICTNGAGAPRTGPYAGMSDEEMTRLRRAEQREAADRGGYRFAAQLDYSSGEAKGRRRKHLVEDLLGLLLACQPRVVYTHNLADKHDTHVGVALAALAALRRMPAALRPAETHGCELWRDLDWLPERDKVVADLGEDEEFQASLLAVFRSQISGGKRYDLGTLGRRRANATFLESHSADRMRLAAYAMDLSPLVRDEKRDIIAYVVGFIRRFESHVARQIAARIATGSQAG
jgi:LmbE family N-acetylglucosaminyl deacetylase